MDTATSERERQGLSVPPEQADHSLAIHTLCAEAEGTVSSPGQPQSWAHSVLPARVWGSFAEGYWGPGCAQGFGAAVTGRSALPIRPSRADLHYSGRAAVNAVSLSWKGRIAGAVL